MMIPTRGSSSPSRSSAGGKFLTRKQSRTIDQRSPLKERRVSMPILKQHSPTGQYLRWTDSWKNKLVSRDINRPRITKERDFFTKRLRRSLQLTRMSIQSSNLFQSEGT